MNENKSAIFFDVSCGCLNVITFILFTLLTPLPSILMLPFPIVSGIQFGWAYARAKNGFLFTSSTTIGNKEAKE